MIIRNSSRYPTDKVENLVKFALRNAPQLERLEVHVRGGKHAFYGRIFMSTENCTCGCTGQRYLIVARIGSRNHFPYLSIYPNHKRCQKYAILLNNWKEALVKVMAHEGMHLLQMTENKPLWEHQAEKHAKTVLAEYRSTIVD